MRTHGRSYSLLCDAQKADVHFLVGGTQTNLTAIAAFLRSHEAVIAPNSGHINVHETGAVEGCGHKILTSESADGKIAPYWVFMKGRLLYSSLTFSQKTMKMEHIELIGLI